MINNITREQVKDILKDVLAKNHKRFRQELAGENEEFLDRVVRQYRAKVARYSWKVSQKWCKWNDDGPVLMPDYTRLYYRKGNTEVIIQELPPQIRLLKFRGGLVVRESMYEGVSDDEVAKVYHFSLALPYTVFLFKYVNGVFTEVRCAFSDRPLKRLEEKPLRPYLSNLDSNLSVCLGVSFDRAQLQRDNVAQQSAYVLSYFWSSIFSDEWSSHFWANRAHFQSHDSRLADLKSWQEASMDNPLFVVEDVQWLHHHEENFGDMVVRMFEDDQENSKLHEELYEKLVNSFLEDVKKTFIENIDSIENKVVEQSLDILADEFYTRLGGQ